MTKQVLLPVMYVLPASYLWQCQAVPVLETAMGIAYCRNGWEVGFGYEMPLWGNVGDRRDFNDDVDEQKFSSASSDLLLDGFFLRLAYNR